MRLFFDYEKCYISKFKENIYCMGNKLNGKFVFIPKECYEIILNLYEEDKCFNDIKSIFEDIEDYIYFNEIVKKLHDIGLVNVKEKLGLKFNNISKIIISVTNNCNLSCGYCCVDSNKNKVYNELSTFEMIQLIDKALKLNPKIIHISGGEPLLRKDIFEVLEYIKSNFNGKIHLSTNGTMIDSFYAKKISETVESVDISLDGYNNDSVRTERGEGVFKKVCDSIENLKNVGLNKINISIVNSKKTNHIINEFISFSKKMSVGYIIRDYYKINSTYKYEYTENILDIQYYDKMYKEEIFMDNCNNCLAGSKEIFFNYDGKIYLCPLLVDNKYELGRYTDIDEEFILELYRREFEAFSNLEKIKTVNREECKDCYFKLFCFKCPSIISNIDDNTFDFNCNRIKELYLTQ